MRDTLAARLDRRARFGHWDRFPVNPDRWCDKAAGRRPPTHVPKGARSRSPVSSESASDASTGRGAPCRTGWRCTGAFHTVGIELAERGDDSYGNIGELRLDAFRTYLGIDWATAGMPPEHYWQGLCELLVSEVYALTHQHETLPFPRVRRR